MVADHLPADAASTILIGTATLGGTCVPAKCWLMVSMVLVPPKRPPLTPEELQADIRESALLPEYGKTIDRESARELLAARLAHATVSGR